MVAQSAGMQLHHQSVLSGKRRHLHQHVRLEPRLIVAIGLSFDRAREHSLDVSVDHPFGVRRYDGVIGRSRSSLLELVAPLPDRCEEVAVTANLHLRRSGKTLELGVPTGAANREQGVRAESRYDSGIDLRVA